MNSNSFILDCAKKRAFSFSFSGPMIQKILIRSQYTSRLKVLLNYTATPVILWLKKFARKKKG